MLASYDEWARRFPDAAKALVDVLGGSSGVPPEVPVRGGDESAAQRQVRLEAARASWLLYRNNVGATPTECEHCRAKTPPVRYGLANESSALNKRFKSGDLIGLAPYVVKSSDVGRTLGLFVSIEVKRPGWSFTGKGREAGQAAWASLINSRGGVAFFSTGGVVQL